MLYRGLIALLERAGGEGFHNADQGHLFYVYAANGTRWDGDLFTDSPENNRHFITLRHVSRALREQGAADYAWFRPELETWQGFCAFAVDCFRKKHDYQE